MAGSNRNSIVKRLQEPWGRGLVPSLASGAFGAAVAARNGAYDAGVAHSKATGRPTISVGGLSAGGTGKTPMALLVGKYLHAREREVVFLSRGYGRKAKETVISPPGTSDNWEMVGDEPAMLHAALPEAWLGVGGNRAATVSALTPRLTSKSVFVLDDAFQHRRLKRDLDIVCLPPNPFTDTLMPSGTLREPLSALKRAHCACLIGTAEDAAALEASRERISREFPLCPVFVFHQFASGWVNVSNGDFQTDPPLERPVALCGIARPQRFIFFLKKMRISISAEAIFSDHHEFKHDERAAIEAWAGSSGIVTTEKDAFRLKSLQLVHGSNMWYLKLDLRFSDGNSEGLFYAIIDKALH